MRWCKPLRLCATQCSVVPREKLVQNKHDSQPACQLSDTLLLEMVSGYDQLGLISDLASESVPNLKRGATCLGWHRRTKSTRRRSLRQADLIFGTRARPAR